MEYKIYTMQHQRLFDELYSVEPVTKINGIINKEINYLSNKYKEIRKDFARLSKCKDVSALYSDIMIKNKKKVYTFEHIVVKNDTLYILERKRGYENQTKLLKEKTKFLKKEFQNKLNIKYYIIVDTNIKKHSYISLENFINEIAKITNKEEIYPDLINNYMQKKHVDITIKEYLKYKYKVDIDKINSPRKGKWVEIVSITLPFLNIYKSRISFISSVILLLYILTIAISYYKNIKDGQFYLSIIIDIIYYKFIEYTLNTIENNLSKKIKYPILLCILIIMVYFFVKTIYYY